MVKKSCRKGRKMNRTRKTRTQRRRRGGAFDLRSAAPVDYALSGSSSSNQSLAQGDDFANYHQAQHGGVAPYAQAFDIMTDNEMLSSSMSSGQLKAIADVRGLHDAQPAALGPTPASPGTMNGNASSCGPMLGGRRRRRRVSKKAKKAKRSKRSQRSQKQRNQRRQGGGALGYSPYPSPGLLLDGPRDYTRAGLNPEFYQSSSTEQLMADARDMA